jgi:hypothetical protein
MGERPSSKHSIEREDVNGNYEPDNCVWASKKMQSRNKRNTLRIVLEGKTVSLKDACEEAGVNYYSARCRLRKGQDPLQRLR